MLKLKLTRRESLWWLRYNSIPAELLDQRLKRLTPEQLRVVNRTLALTKWTEQAKAKGIRRTGIVLTADRAMRRLVAREWG